MHRYTMRWLTVWTILITLAATGCESVVTTEPFGERVTDVDQLNERMAGVWQIGDGGIVYVRVGRDAAVNVATVEVNDDGFEFNEVRVTVHEHEERWYLFGPTDYVDEDDAPQYDFLRLTFPDSETMLVMFPDAVTFREAVEAEEVVGEVRGRTFLQTMVEEHEADDEANEDRADRGDAPAEREPRGSDRKIVLTDRASVEAFINADDVGRQFVVDAPFVLRRLTGPPERDED